MKKALSVFLILLVTPITTAYYYQSSNLVSTSATWNFDKEAYRPGDSLKLNISYALNVPDESLRSMYEDYCVNRDRSNITFEQLKLAFKDAYETCKFKRIAFKLTPESTTPSCFSGIMEITEPETTIRTAGDIRKFDFELHITNTCIPGNYKLDFEPSYNFRCNVTTKQLFETCQCSENTGCELSLSYYNAWSFKSEKWSTGSNSKDVLGATKSSPIIVQVRGLSYEQEVAKFIEETEVKTQKYAEEGALLNDRYSKLDFQYCKKEPECTQKKESILATIDNLNKISHVYINIKQLQLNQAYGEALTKIYEYNKFSEAVNSEIITTESDLVWVDANDDPLWVKVIAYIIVFGLLAGFLIVVIFAIRFTLRKLLKDTQKHAKS